MLTLTSLPHSPLTPGHEVIGSIVAVGAGVKQWNTGDLVGGAWHGGHDGTCHQCQAGDFQLCSNAAINGVSRNGGYAEYCLLRAEAAVPIPTDADAAVYAPLLCAGVTVFNSIRHMGVSPGATVAIQGLGGLGHLGLQYASKMGYRTVALSSSDAKEKFAKDLGAHEYVDGSKGDQGEALQKLGGADLIVCTAPNPKIIPGLIAGLAPKGKLLVVAVAGEIPVDTTSLITKALSVHGWPSGHALDSEEAIRFADVHNVKCMIEKFPLEKAPEAFEHMLSGKARFRAVLVME
ncbi:hypothetical protein MMC25_003789 [Agyrium rufum]|nr:hypothetical protein [Agyrium rufum]